MLRIRTDDSRASGNPFIGRARALLETWSYGHQNIRSTDIDAQGRLWTVERGLRRGDELNRPKKGTNYGWLLITYANEY